MLCFLVNGDGDEDGRIRCAQLGLGRLSCPGAKASVLLVFPADPCCVGGRIATQIDVQSCVEAASWPIVGLAHIKQSDMTLAS